MYRQDMVLVLVLAFMTAVVRSQMFYWHPLDKDKPPVGTYAVAKDIFQEVPEQVRDASVNRAGIVKMWQLEKLKKAKQSLQHDASVKRFVFSSLLNY
ncbi:hypothetical protein L596_021023 [Steinernema carpocapsae]|uniref:Uncharacterized protein n=1 Tax=Steinernema carpocapsae TaxID=34508 RepID=A0A4U5MV74_STECR|nr:hypothetical protein L596_021023 [Steinernema carpocapsae]